MPPAADLRDYLAVERTFLAWIRTGLALMGFAFVVARFGLFLQQIQLVNHSLGAHSTGLSLWFGTALIAAGILVHVSSAWRHVQLVRQLDQGHTGSSRSLSYALSTAIFLAVVGLAMAIYLLSVRNTAANHVSAKKEFAMPADNGIVTKQSHHSVEGCTGVAMRSFLAAGFIWAMASVLPAHAQNRTVYTVDTKQSKIEVHVYREGFLKAFGHDHQMMATEFSGTVQLAEPDASASSVTLVVETKSLVVLDPGEAEKDRKEVQETMLGESVLDAPRFPRIQFASSKVRSTARKGEAADLEVEGTLSLHGAAKLVSLPVHILVSGGQLTGDGEVSLLQTDYGISPIKVGGGAVRVKDKLKLSFHIVAKKENGSNR